MPSQITNARQQEYLARRDRQLMCRDIYVMLYTFGGGNDAKNYTTANPREDLNRNGVLDAGEDANGNMALDPEPLYGTSAMSQKGNQARQMAQFAVNLVDRLDPDDTITRFEYDTNLANGWNLDDNPYDTTDGGEEREEVYGVESQKLAISEALVLFCGKYIEDGMAKNHDATEIDDTLTHDFTFLELENVSPFNVDFGSGEWQIVIKERPDEDANNNGRLDPGEDINGNGLLDNLDEYVEERRLTFLGGTVLNAGSATGPRFSLGTSGDTQIKDVDGTSPAPTRFIVQPQWDELIPAPDVRIAPAGTLNLDLMKQQAMYRINKAPTTAGSYGDGDKIVPSDPTNEPSGQDLLAYVPTADLDSIVDNLVSVRIELRRRANLTRTPPDELLTGNQTAHESESADNPWVVVDFADVPLQVFQIPPDTKAGDSGPTAGEKIRQALTITGSSERFQPLDGHAMPEFTVPPATGSPTNTLSNTTAESKNSQSPVKFTLWQSHFDRDYASAVELFDVPVYGPSELTWAGTISTSPSLSKKASASNNTFDERGVASYEFMNPDNPDTTDIQTTPGAVDDKDNRWYRLLGLVEVPSRLVRANDSTPWYAFDVATPDSNPPGFYRVPGKINLNTLRHPAVLAGLLDDMNVMTFDANVSPQTLEDRVDMTRDWYEQFMLSRDGLDPITNLRLPGLPFADPAVGAPAGRPFRSLGFAARGLTSIEDTILRQLPGDGVQAPPETARRLFELGSLDQHNSVSPAESVPPSVRDRLLQKVLNNTTTRSNVFLIFVQLDYFEAAEVPDPGTGQQVVRIGAKRADSPGNRAFFVVDRSKALELLKQKDIPNVATTGSYSINQSFNYQSLILYRQTIK